jgi:hypothetical protein
MIYDSTVADGSFEMSLKCSELRSLCNSTRSQRNQCMPFICTVLHLSDVSIEKRQP